MQDSKKPTEESLHVFMNSSAISTWKMTGVMAKRPTLKHSQQSLSEHHELLLDGISSKAECLRFA